MKVIDKKSRKVLNEGRTSGMAFAFLQKKGNSFYTVQPLSPCKDYLAEVVFTEKYDIPTRAYGLTYKKKLDIFTDCAYMVIKILPRLDGGYAYGPSLDHDVKLLNDNYKHIERLINEFEKELGLMLTTITPVQDNTFVVKLSSDWCTSTHSISLYSLLLRVLMVATEKDKDFMSFLESFNYYDGDTSLLKQCFNKIKLILDMKKLPANSRPYSRNYLAKYMQTPHDNGIVSWEGNFEEVELID